MVKFCPRCSNIFAYTLVVDDNVKRLRYKCTSCQFEEEITGLEDNYESAVLFTQKTLNKMPDRLVTPEMCFDQSLPHATSVPCPNSDCPSNDSKNKEAFKKYDSVFFHRNEEMKLGYICCYCQVFWKVD